MTARFVIGAVVAGAVLAGCHTTTTTVDNTIVTDLGANDTMVADEGASEEEGDTEQVSAPGGWTLSQRDDPMTDGHVLVLTTAIAGRINDVDLEVSCDPAARSLHYAIAGFDKQRQGASMSVDFAGGAARHLFTVRIDGGSIQRSASPVRYDNQIDVQFMTPQVVDAQHLVLGIPFRNSDETYVVDQSGATFRNAIEQCRATVAAADQAEQQRQAAMADAAAQQQRQQDAQPVTVNRQTGPGWQDTRATPETPADSSQPTGWNSITTR